MSTRRHQPHSSTSSTAMHYRVKQITENVLIDNLCSCATLVGIEDKFVEVSLIIILFI